MLFRGQLLHVSDLYNIFFLLVMLCLALYDALAPLAIIPGHVFYLPP